MWEGSGIWIVVLSGLGTFALRWLPWRHARRRADRQTASRVRAATWFEQGLAGVGPAAVAALLLVSLWGLVTGAGGVAWAPVLAVLAGLVAVAGVRRLVDGMAWPTLLGALCYGAVMQWLGG